MTLQEQLQAEETKLSELQKQYDNAVIEREFCQKKLKELSKLIDDIKPAWPNELGHFERQQRIIAALKVKIADENKPAIQFIDRGWLRENVDYVLEKVTKKRVYIRERGRQRTEIFNHDGSSISECANQKIDTTGLV